MQPIRASVIIPTYNSAHFIQKCLDSVLTQTEKNIEIIIVDDGSTDTTCSIIQTYTDPRIHLLVQKTNTGPGTVRNIAITYARGIWLVFLDSDDWIEKERVALLCDYAEFYSIDVLFDDCFLLYSNGVRATKRLFKTLGLPTTNTTMDVATHLRFTPSIHPIMRADFLRTHAITFLENVHRGEDLYMWILCYVYDAKMCTYLTPLYTYRIHDKSLTHNRLNTARDMIQVYVELLAHPKIQNNLHFTKLILAKKEETEIKLRIRTVYGTGTVLEKIHLLPRIFLIYIKKIFSR